MKQLFSKITSWLHLWVGMITGIIVFIISITGALYVFHQEIKDTMEPWRFVEPQNKSFVPPSQLIDTATVYIPGIEPSGLSYEDKSGAAAVGFFSKSHFSVVYLNPYTGRFIKKIDSSNKGKFDFFSFIIHGHRALWLPYSIGRPIIGLSTLLFLLLLITGLFKWWPKHWNKKSLKRILTIKNTPNKKKLNYDLHNVLGFYIIIFACVFAITGLTWSFPWFKSSYFYVISGGKNYSEQIHPHSDIKNSNITYNDSIPPLDKAWYRVIAQEKNPQRIYITLSLKNSDDPIEIFVSLKKGRFYKSNEYFFDRYTLEPIHNDSHLYNNASNAEKLMKMNYDIHTGAIFGLPGKIFAFLISLVIASLPITGYIIYFNKKGWF